MTTDAEKEKIRKLCGGRHQPEEWLVGDFTGRVERGSECEVRLDDGRIVYGHPTGRMRQEFRLLQEGDRVIVLRPEYHKGTDRTSRGYLWCFVSDDSYRLNEV